MQSAQGGHVELEIGTREVGDLRILDLRGRLTIGETSDHLHRELAALIRGGWRKILVNLVGVDKIDSSGISALVRNSIGMTRAGGSLKLVCPAGRVRDALELTRLVSAIPTFDSEPRAFLSFE